MKSYKFTLFFILFLLSANFMMANAIEIQTEYSYKPFCMEIAKSRLEQFNKMTEEDVKKIEILKKDINDLEARKKISDDLNSIKDRYLKNISNIANQQKIMKNTSFVEEITSFKNLLRNTMNLNAIALLNKQNNPIITNPTIESICKNNISNMDLSLCKFVSIKKDNPEIELINKTLTNFSNSMIQVKDTNKESLAKKIDNIYETIPKELSPQAILDEVSNKAPNLKQLALNALSVDEVLNCLKGNHQICESLIINYDKTKNINKLTDKESSDVKNTIIAHSIKAKSEPILKQELADDTKSEMTELKDRLDQMINHNPRLQIIEKLKKYTAQKYIRTCNQDSKDTPSLVSNISLIKCNIPSSSNPSAGNIDNLSGSFSEILGKLQDGNAVTQKGDNQSTFSKDEILTFNEYCSETSQTDSIIKETCKDVLKENKKVAAEKKPTDWDEYNRKYWVSYSPSSASGYQIYEKKSNTRIIGDSLAQNLGSIVPMWFQNYQLNSQIDYMTDEAMYMKQMNYMNSATSPWALYNPYFQGSFYGSTGMYSMPIVNGYNFSN